MVDRDPGFLRKSATAALVAGLGFLAACGGSDASPTSFANADTTPRQFLSHMYKLGFVRKCVGETTLRTDGHIRTSPTVENHEDSSNAVEGISSNVLGDVVLRNPQLITVDKTDDKEVSPQWYVLGMPGYDTVFVNRDALDKAGAFVCDGVADDSTPLGEVSFQPLQHQPS